MKASSASPTAPTPAPHSASFPNQTTLLIVVSLVAIGFLFYFYRAHAMPSLVLRFAIGLQLGGAFGNLIDRVLNGEVVDFIDVGPWPIFNLADSSNRRRYLHPHGDLPADQGVEGRASGRPDVCGERDTAPTGLDTGLDEG